MCKVKQLSGEAPRANNYCTAREYEVLTIIAKNEGYKVGDVIDGENLSNKTIGRTWEITECDRVEGGRVTTRDNKGNEKTCQFVFGGKHAATTTTTKKEGNNNNNNNKENKTMETTTTTSTTADNSSINTLLANLQAESYNKGKEAASAEYTAKIDTLTREIEELKNTHQGGSTIIVNIDGQQIKNEIEGIVNPKFKEILAFLLSGEHVYLFGPAGSGKNVLCEQLAKAMEAEFFYVNTLYTKYDITGFMDATGKFIETVAYKFLKSERGVLMLDEIDNSQAEALIPINALLANGYLTFANGETLYLDENHKIIAAGNTNGQGATEEYNGRYKMDESTRDRFAFFFIDYDKAVEEAIVGDKKDILSFIYDLRSICESSQISMILGYRAINKLVKFDKMNIDEATIINTCILKGIEQDTINEIASRLDNSTKWHKAFKSLAR